MKIAVVLSGYFGTISANNMDSGRISHKKITNFFKGGEEGVLFSTPRL